MYSLFFSILRVLSVFSRVHIHFAPQLRENNDTKLRREDYSHPLTHTLTSQSLSLSLSLDEGPCESGGSADALSHDVHVCAIVCGLPLIVRHQIREDSLQHLLLGVELRVGRPCVCVCG